MGRQPTQEPKRRSRRVIFQPTSQNALGRGIAQLVGAVRPTLGPLPRLTAVEDPMRHNTPEILDDGGTICRRIIQIADRDADMGAMLLRHTLWKLREEYGDGTATAAVLFQAIFDEGRRYAAAGGNAMILKTGLERGMKLAYQALGEMARPLEGEEAITKAAEAICYDAPMAKMLGEIFDIIGEYGHLELRTGNNRQLSRDYVEGAYWDSGWQSPHLITDEVKRETRLDDAAILITDLKITDVQALAKVVDLVFRNGGRALVVISYEISDNALAVLLLNKERANVVPLAVKAPTPYSYRGLNLQDIAVLTGGRAFIDEAGDTLNGVRWEDLGQARRAWATRDNFGIVGGKGNLDTLRQHIDTLRKSLQHIKDADLRNFTQQRIGRLMGGAALLWVGGDTDAELTFRKELAERTATALRGALRDGVVPGGGMALRACQRVLLEAPTSSGEEEKVAFRILARALETPARAILENAGYEPSSALLEVSLAGPDAGFDVRSGKVVNMFEAGILDSVTVLQAALRSAVTAASLALTTDVLIHSAKPEQKFGT